MENTCAPDYQRGLGRERKGAVSINRRRCIGETEHYVEKREEGTRFGYVFKCVRGAIRLPRFGFQGPVAVHPEYAHKFIIEVLFIEASMAGHLNMKRRSPGEWCPLPKEERDSRHCPRVRARAMAAFDYLIDSEYSGGPGTGGGVGISLCLTSCRYPPMARERGVVAIVFVASTCPACVRAYNTRVYIYIIRGPDLRGKGTTARKSRDNSARKRRVTRINGRFHAAPYFLLFDSIPP